MGDKKKKTFMFIRLVSAAGTGFFYVKRKSAKKVAEKLEFRKYDPREHASTIAKLNNDPLFASTALQSSPAKRPFIRH
ncbi:hypothetical protein Goshw_006110 [Gossypium schwendimanii]|uniref:Large ribosomal subunit protein bL33c n=4 Tax=Gossypium TaxID=3633 RepID=A0A7J9FTG5_9ROSI|nr:hypothetical protein [Gossypium lobatum]MBA0788610.1 hypothetical protein [Gossypium trilobum]MBA0801439.1 hypothetical protein [Gossypium harknessii]MBA0857005.1 hypothetical protein [Gossypium schwendimanii]